MDAADWVLSKFTKEEGEQLEDIFIEVEQKILEQKVHSAYRGIYFLYYRKKILQSLYRKNPACFLLEMKYDSSLPVFYALFLLRKNLPI
jgi:hypothetical protein